MRKNPLYLLLAILEIVRFSVLALLAMSLGVFSMPAAVLSLWRYAAAPQLLFALALFFMWFDYDRYGVYRPLVLGGQIVLLLVLLPLAAALISPGLAGPRQYIYLGILALLDLLLVVLLAQKPRSGQSGAGQAGQESSMDPAPSGSADKPGASGPRGPEDIEKVE